MDINSFPSEILSIIMGHLIDAKKYHDDKPYLADICQARLVCRNWDQVTRRHIFRDVTLRHTTEDFVTWNSMLDSPMIRNIARCADIHSTALRVAKYEAQYYGVWKEGRCDALTKSIARVSELKNLNSLVLRFSLDCWGVETGSYSMGYAQTIAQRRYFLQAVFQAVADRALQAGVSPIRSLTIHDLQNVPIPEIITSDSFKDATKDVEQLSLDIVIEAYEHGGPLEYAFIERQTFEPFLQNVMLPAFADRLTSLSICMWDGWGVAPSTFDGQGLVFPHLKTAMLGAFFIAHHNQLDWLLSSSILESLRLIDCCICTHMTIDKDPTRHHYKVPMHDWVKHPQGTFGVDPSDIPYTFSGTWAQFLDKIRTSQPRLVDFCFHTTYPNENLMTPWLETNKITEDRYAYAKLGSCAEIEWHTYFGMNAELRQTGQMEIDPARDHLEEDTRALEELKSAILERRRLL